MAITMSEYEENLENLRALYPDYSGDLLHAFNSIYFDLSLTYNQTMAYNKWLYTREVEEGCHNA